MTEEERIAAEKAAAEKVAAEKAEADRIAKEKADKEAAEKEKNKPSDTEAKLLKELMEYKAKAKKAEEEKAATEAKFAGIDPEEAKKAMEAKAAAEKAELEKKGEYDRIVKQMAEQSEAKLKAKEEEANKAKSDAESLKQTINRLTIGNSFASSSAIQETVLSPAKAEQLYGAHFDVEDGVVIAYDKPRGAAERTKLVDDKGQPVGFDVAIDKIIKADPDYERLKKSQMKPGANSKTQHAAGADEDRDEEPSGVDRIRAALASSKK